MKKFRIALSMLMLIAIVACTGAMAAGVSLKLNNLGNGKVECTVSNAGGFFELYVNNQLKASVSEDNKTVTVSANAGDTVLVSSKNGETSAVVPGAAEPTAEPTTEPTEEPTTEPTEEPTEEPTTEPTAEPTTEPTEEPTTEPTEEPTEEPTTEPTAKPTTEPTKAPAADNTDDTDVPKTGDTRVSYALVIGMIAIAAGILLARRFGHEK